MTKYSLSYVAPNGDRLPDLLDRHFSDMDQARRAALSVLADFLEAGTATPGTLGHIEITDDRNQCVAEVHFPQS